MQHRRSDYVYTSLDEVRSCEGEVPMHDMKAYEAMEV
jgi:hypothetical protein